MYLYFEDAQISKMIVSSELLSYNTEHIVPWSLTDIQQVSIISQQIPRTFCVRDSKLGHFDVHSTRATKPMTLSQQSREPLTYSYVAVNKKNIREICVDVVQMICRDGQFGEASRNEPQILYANRQQRHVIATLSTGPIMQNLVWKAFSGHHTDLRVTRFTPIIKSRNNLNREISSPHAGAITVLQK